MQDPLKQIQLISRLESEGCLQTLQNSDVQEVLRNTEFIVADAAFHCSFVAASLYSIPLAWYTIVGLIPPILEGVGPSPAAYVPTFGSALSDNMTLFEATKNWFNSKTIQWIGLPIIVKIICEEVYRPLNLTLGKHDINTFSGCGAVVREITSRSGIKLVLSDLAFEFPRDIAHNVQFVGNPLATPAAEISDDKLSKFIQSATAGFVVISLGNHGSWNSRDRTLAIARALRTQLPENVRVIWKVSGADKDLLQQEIVNQSMRLEKGGNDGEVIKYVEWMPQNDILGHVNCKCFVTHGGMNSVQEAAYHGVPVVGTALLADQFDNIARCVRHGFGQNLDTKSFTSETLVTKINNVFTDPTYALAAR